MLVVVSGPSGVGKDTILEVLRQLPGHADHHYVVTCTTRARRPGEIDGLSYHFLEPAEFMALRDRGGLLEANEVHGNWYGTPRQQVVDALAAGRHAVLKIDVQGAEVIRARVPDALLIFVVPPSIETLAGRLKGRATETDAQLEERLRNAADELARQHDYDYVVVNETGQLDRDRRADRRDHRPRGSPPRGAPGPDLMTSPPPPERLVEVAIDAAGAAGARTYTYSVPPRLAGLESGEAVLVEYGRRQALGVVLGEPRERPAAGLNLKPVVDRVRADGPLLPPLSLELARWIAGHYLAPAAFVLRAMLPPGMLERLELVAEARPGGATAATRQPRRPLRKRLLPWWRPIPPCSISSPPARGPSATWLLRRAGPA